MESRMELERAERGSSTMLRKAEGVHGGREDGGREVVVADEDLSNFAQVRSARVWCNTATTKQVQTTSHISPKFLPYS